MGAMMPELASRRLSGNDSGVIVDEVDVLFDPSVVVLSAAVSDDAIALLHPEEAAYVAHAMPKRRREHATGRALARLALDRIGVAPCAIPNDDDRAPIWPAGVRGSITHCDTRALVAVCRAEHGSVGIDVEHRRELGRHLWAMVFLDDEVRALEATAETERGRMALALFSAKEALYKAQHPISRRYMGFRALHVNANEGTLTCTWQEDVPPFTRGHVARGRYLLAAPPTGELVTAVHLP
jgi:4'-phosphopantetheinyl transferase EntD